MSTLSRFSRLSMVAVLCCVGLLAGRMAHAQPLGVNTEIVGDPSNPNLSCEVDNNEAISDFASCEQDLDCVLPLERAGELGAKGFLGDVAATHYSFMGYLLRPETFLETSVPAMIEGLKAEEVDVVLLVPV